MKNLYTSDGFVNFDAIYNTPAALTFVIGGRCTGKTYGGLQYMLRNNITFAYMRRTQAQLDIASQDETSVFKALNTDMGLDIKSKANKQTYIYTRDNDDNPTVVGYGFALSTISNVRGFSMEDIDVCLYDEFIPEPHERGMKNEVDAFFNAYSTIARTRELKGRPALKFICMGNSNELTNSILINLNIVEDIEKMKRAGKEYRLIKNREIAIYILDSSPAAREMSKTALSRIAAGTQFAEMAFNNNFAYNNSDNIQTRIPYTEYAPIINLGDAITIMQHKHSNMLICTTKHFDARYYYPDTNEGRRQMCVNHTKLCINFYANNIIYNSSGAYFFLKRAMSWR